MAGKIESGQNRVKQVLDYISQAMQEKIRSRFTEINRQFGSDFDGIQSDFYNVLNSLFAETAKFQEENRKNEIAYVSLSYLRSSILTGNPKIRIDLYDKDFLLDTAETWTVWHPGFLFHGLSEDISFAKQQAKKKFVRVMDYEIDEFRYYYHQIIFIMAYPLIQELTRDVQNLAGYTQLSKASAVRFIYGEYLDKSAVLHQFGKEL